MKVLITLGPTREPIDAVRYLGNRSSGRTGVALAAAAAEAGHAVTLVAGPIAQAVPPVGRRIDVETSGQMLRAVLSEYPSHDLLIMAAAVADYRPARVHEGKLSRAGGLVIECEPTEDILAAAGRIKRADQRTVGFSLELRGNLERSREKLVRKNLDLIVYNPTETMNSGSIESVLIWADGRTEELPLQPKEDFARVLIARVQSLWPQPPAGGT